VPSLEDSNSISPQLLQEAELAYIQVLTCLRVSIPSELHHSPPPFEFARDRLVIGRAFGVRLSINPPRSRHVGLPASTSTRERAS